MALCRKAGPGDLHVAGGEQPLLTNNVRQKDFDFVERPSQDFFCPVSLELLLEPQQTSCCGNHLSLEVTTRLQREGKPCPMCNGEQWSAMLDKYHRRKVYEVRVRCWHKDNGCGWVGEINGLKRHADSCELRPWQCKYCGLKCTYGEGEGKHWPKCTKFPEPCPNSCEVGTVERCNMEQHRSVCSLEPVPCEMKEFGCSVVVPRKELATHMKESELQHLTAMTMLNLRLTKQLQQDSTERNKKIAQLQEEMTHQKKLQTEMKTEMKMKMDEITEEQKKMPAAMLEEQKKMQAEINTRIDKQKKEFKTDIKKLAEEEATSQKKLQTEMKLKMNEIITAITDEQNKMQTTMLEAQKVQAELLVSEQKRELSLLKTDIEKVKHTTHHIEQHTSCGVYGACEVFTFTKYSERKCSRCEVYRGPFYSHNHGYKFKLRIYYYSPDYNDIGAHLYLMKGEYDDQLKWPVEVKVQLELLNQNGDHHHVMRTENMTWNKNKRDNYNTIDDSLMKYPDLEKSSDGIQYMRNDCLKFRVHVTVIDLD